MRQAKSRLDVLLYRRGLVESREKARRLILAGQVLVDGQVVDKVGRQVDQDATIEIRESLPYVGRGGLKLAKALDAFRLDVRGSVAADVGASTGGFTDCLLQRGARRVYAIDVGYGQLHWNLRRDPRVVVMERVNARYLDSLPEPIDLVTIDVSFISLRLILPNVARWLKPDGDVVALIKPQFEAGVEQVGKGGVVRSEQTHRQVLSSVLEWAGHQGWRLVGLVRSPIRGAKGNVEFLAHLRRDTGPMLDLAQAVEGVLADEGVLAEWDDADRDCPTCGDE
ncbi:MAG: TlyA family RNA methyltransferase [Chloroflexi bacterium]|nr:TlyA family RNA methyltransferase [Chloroflexota bacterium]